MSELQAGALLSRRYQIEAKLGEGGMAVVFRAVDLQRRVTVALKLLKPDYAEDATFVQRFRREARSLQRLSHPNIVRFYDLEEVGDLAFLVLDFIDGPTLRKLMRGRGQPLTPGEVLGFLRPICAALSYAHHQGVVHCDMKPANVMIDHTGRVFVNDFGIARLSESATITFSTPGTVAYMAPEQWRGGEEVYPSTDVYALGVMLSELLTGQLPFRGETAPSKAHNREKIMWEHLHGDVPAPSRINLAVPQQLDAIVLRCLEKEAGHRYQTVDVLFAAMEVACRAAGIVEVPVSVPDSTLRPAGNASPVLNATATPPRTGRVPLGVGLLSGFGLAVIGTGVVASIAVLAFLAAANRGGDAGTGSSTADTSFTTQTVLVAQITATSTDLTVPSVSELSTVTLVPPLIIEAIVSATPRQTEASQATVAPPIAAAFQCSGAPTTRLRIGDRARVTYTSGVPTRVRASPGTSGKYLGQVSDGTPLTVLGGPACVDSRVWWNVEAQTSSHLTGWMMEGVPGTYYMELAP